jgi:hypothetical protein
MQALIVILSILIILYFIWDIREHFYNPYLLWTPTRSTRLMSYDIRGDPFSYFVYPSYYSWNAPFRYYLYNGDRYDIFGRYLVPKRYARDNRENERNINNKQNNSKKDEKKDTKK